LFKSVKSLSIICLLIFSDYVLFNSISSLAFKRINLILFLVPVVLVILIIIKQELKKNKSINLEYAGFYATFSFFILNMLVQLGDFTGFYEELSMDKNRMLAIVTILNLLFFYGGIKVYLSSIKKYNNLYKKLQEL